MGKDMFSFHYLYQFHYSAVPYQIAVQNNFVTSGFRDKDDLVHEEYFRFRTAATDDSNATDIFLGNAG